MDIIGKGFADKDTQFRGIRRADNFAKMAVAATAMACSNFQVEDQTSDISIILSTQFGPHVTTFKFLDNLLDYSDSGVSPTTFSHSVHNAAASYIASSLGICGQTLTITSFIDPLKQSLIMAESWLELQLSEKVIVCYAEEQSFPLMTAHLHCDFPSYSKDMIPFGAAALLLTKGNYFTLPEKILNPFTYIKEL